MSDDNKKTFSEKAATMAAIGAGIVAGAAVVPQDELMKEGIPGFLESLKGIAHLSWLRLEEAAKKFRPVAFAWGSKLWSLIKWWTLISFALIVAGIEVKTRFGSNSGHVLVAAGALSFAALGFTLFVLTDGIASILYFKIKVAGGVLNKVTSLVKIDLSEIVDVKSVEAQAKADKFRDQVRIILAGTVVLCLSLTFTLFFPAWSTLGWTLCIWVPISVIVLAATHLKLELGKGVKVAMYASIAILVGMIMVFLLDRVTGGELGFAGFQKWFRGINRSEVLSFVLVLVPVTLLLVGAFAKDKDKKSAYMASAKYVGITVVVLGAFLLYKGTISWKQLSGKDAPKSVNEVVETIENGSIKNIGGGSSSETRSSSQGNTSGGAKYLSPAQMDAIVPRASDHPIYDTPSTRAGASKPRAKKPPLPPLKAKKYDDAATAVTDLESLL